MVKLVQVVPTRNGRISTFCCVCVYNIDHRCHTTLQNICYTLV